MSIFVHLLPYSNFSSSDQHHSYTSVTVTYSPTAPPASLPAFQALHFLSREKGTERSNVIDSLGTLMFVYLPSCNHNHSPS